VTQTQEIVDVIKKSHVGSMEEPEVMISAPSTIRLNINAFSSIVGTLIKSLRSTSQSSVTAVLQGSETG
jgi:hypothetical protein